MSGLGYEASASTDAKQAVHGTIEVDAPVQVKQASVGSEGGKITVDQAGSPLEGLTIDVPAGAYASSRTFMISSSSVTDHSFGEYFNPVTPLITIEGAHDFADEIILVTIPINVSGGQFAMAFYYDDSTKSLEGLPVVSVNDHSITVATRHFSNIIVSAILDTTLDAVPEADSGFRPGKDDWEFVNNGSYVAPGGQCAGQSVSMMWYFTEQRQKLNAPQLNGRYDNNGREKTPLINEDDTLGYRFASDIHKKMSQKKYFKSIGSILFDVNGSTTLKFFKYSILLTGEPQQVFIWSAANEGHAIVCYKVSGDTMYIADPNFPGQERTIQLSGYSLTPYGSGANSQDIAEKGITLYPEIVYIAKSGLINWNLIGTEYAKVGDGTIGDDIFPPYLVKITVTDDSGKESYYDFDAGKNAEQKSATVEGRNVSIGCYDKPGTPLSGGLYTYIYVDGQITNTLKITLKEGHNYIGVEGVTKSGNFYPWLGFDWIDLYYEPSDQKLLHEKVYYDSGALREEYDYSLDAYGNKIKQGEVRTYYKSGGIHYITNVKDGKADGKSYTYTEDGTLYTVEEYKNGVQDGHTIGYNKDRIVEVDYSNGKQVEGSYKVTNL